jgi:hypothetical protein
MKSSASPEREGFVLAALNLAPAVAYLNLAAANVALPSIGAAFAASQTVLNLITVGYSLDLSASSAPLALQTILSGLMRTSPSSRWPCRSCSVPALSRRFSV